MQIYFIKNYLKAFFLFIKANSAGNIRGSKRQYRKAWKKKLCDADVKLKAKFWGEASQMSENR